MPTIAEPGALAAELEETLEGIADFLLATADYGRTDRLWPPHFMLFDTNPMSVAYGACGTAAALRRLRGDVPDAVKEWLLARPLSVDTYPPGLFVGLAGIAWVLDDLGLGERAAEAMRLAYASPLLYAEDGMFLGAAGWGLAALRLHGRTGDEEHLRRAVDAGEHLLRSAEQEDGALFWTFRQERKVHYGYAYGASGVALFLLYLGLRTGREEFVDAARRAIAYEMAHRLDSSHGISWSRHEGDNLLLPYWMYGSAGVGTTVIRIAHHLGDPAYRAMAEEIAERAYTKWAVLPSLLEGMSGIGDFLLDMHRFTGEPRWHEMALDMAETVSWYRIERPQGIGYPGRWLTRMTTDYDTGSAGVGLFLHRVLHGGPRMFVDLED